jgi:serine/threonine protein kinase
VQVQLTLETGVEVGRSWVLRLAQSFVLGRSRRNPVYLEDDRISRRHAEVELRADGNVYVTDLGSRNGTLLAGERLAPHVPTKVSPGDLLELGDHALRADFVGLDDRSRRERSRTKRLDEPLLPREEFEVLGEIGRGATGRVYAARQRLLNRTVAVKVLRNEAQDHESLQRFLREGQVCCRIQSPYVVQVHDVRMAQGRIYMVMELINGPSAKDGLARGPLPIPDALRICEDVANALEAAHAAGAIHRDVKPANILLSPEGIAKLGDFGIAKDLDAVQSLTGSGEGLGTLAYVSPEQATEAKAVDPRTDIYGLGATLFHFLAGRPPFLPQNARVLLEIIDDPPPPLAELRRDCPREVVLLVHEMLSKEPSDRPSPAALVARKLREIRERRYPDYVPPTAVREMDLGESTEGQVRRPRT